MNKALSILVICCVAAIGFAAYETKRSNELATQLSASKGDTAKLGRRVTDENAQIQKLQSDMDILQAKADKADRFQDEVIQLAANLQAAPAKNTPMGEAKPDNPIPANQIAAEKPITPLTPEELADRIEVALKRTPELLTAVTQQDLANMPTAYEWGSGNDRRIFRLIDPNTYLEVYPDGSYSVFPILGRAVVKGSKGVITTKDDGALDVFIPDKGERMVHLLRGSGSGSTWEDYRTMENVE